MAYDSTMAGLLEDALAGLDGVTRRRMFGALAFWVDGEMFALVGEEGIVLKLSETDRVEALAMPESEVFSPGGPPMKALIVLSADILDSAPILADWVRRSHAYARSLRRTTGPPRSGSRRSPKSR